MIRVIQHHCARSYEWTIAALEMGVKCRADVVCWQEPPRERAGFGISQLAHKIRNRRRVWRALWRGSGLVVDERMDLGRGANDDVIATDIRRRGETIPRIINISEQINQQSGERPAQKLNWRSVIR